MDSLEDPYGATIAWENEVLNAGKLPGSSNVRFKSHAFGDLDKRR